MGAVLDGHVSVPLYQRVKDHLKCSIENGSYEPGTQIPTETELARDFSVGRVTVRRAIEELVGEGYLTKQQGRGTFVNTPKMLRKVHQKDDVQSFSDACRENGMEPGAHVVAREIIPADETLARFFGIELGTELICISRVRTADGIPVLLENNSYPLPEFDFLRDADMEDCSIFRLVGERTGRFPASSEPCTLEISRADADMASMLSVPVGEPMFFMSVGFLDEEDRPFCFGRQFYVGSRYSFDI